MLALCAWFPAALLPLLTLVVLFCFGLLVALLGVYLRLVYSWCSWLGLLLWYAVLCLLVMLPQGLLCVVLLLLWRALLSSLGGLSFVPAYGGGAEGYGVCVRACVHAHAVYVVGGVW